MKPTKTRSRQPGPHITNGKPRPGGRLENFIARQDPRNLAIFEGDLAFVSVDGQHPRKAVLNRADFHRLTADNPDGPRLTRSRWWLDDDNMLRAFSLHEMPFTHGVLVAAALLDVKEGATLILPADPLDLRLSQIKRA